MSGNLLQYKEILDLLIDSHDCHFSPEDSCVCEETREELATVNAELRRAYAAMKERNGRVRDFRIISAHHAKMMKGLTDMLYEGSIRRNKEDEE